MLTCDTTRIDESEILFRYSDGADPPLLFLPGGVVDHIDLTWKTVVRRLSLRYRVYAPDLPGFGRSRGLPEARYGTAYVASFARKFMRATGIRQPVLFANSLSGGAAIEIGLHHPAEICGLVLSGAYGWQPTVPFHRLVHALVHLPRADSLMRAFMRLPGVVRWGLGLLFEDRTRIDDELMEDAHAGADAPQAPRAFVEWLRSDLGRTSLRSDHRSVLSRLSVPTLILQGASDWLAPERYARAAADSIRGARYHVLDTGHLVPRERPDEATEIIVSFLEEISA